MQNSVIQKTFYLLLILIASTLFGCQKESFDSRDRFVATDVFVKVKEGFEIQKVFEFINLFEHEVERISSLTYTSDLHSDSLQFVLDQLNAKSYMHGKASWNVNGYLHYQTKKITVFPRLFDMNSPTNQSDWLKTMKILKLNEGIEDGNNGSIIYFHVPAGFEKDWINKFKKYDFVEWAELNTLYDKDPLN